MEVFTQLKPFVNPISTSVGKHISKLLCCLYPSHFFNVEMADM